MHPRANRCLFHERDLGFFKCFAVLVVGTIIFKREKLDVLTRIILIQTGSMGNNLGSSWKLVNGLLKQIDSGPYGVVYGTNSRSELYYRAGITDSDPKGTSWTPIQGHVNYISCGIYNCWGVNGVSKVFVRTEVSRQTPAGNLKIFCTVILRIQNIL